MRCYEGWLMFSNISVKITILVNDAFCTRLILAKKIFYFENKTNKTKQITKQKPQTNKTL